MEESDPEKYNAAQLPRTQQRANRGQISIRIFQEMGGHGGSTHAHGAKFGHGK